MNSTAHSFPSNPIPICNHAIPSLVQALLKGVASLCLLGITVAVGLSGHHRVIAQGVASSVVGQGLPARSQAPYPICQPPNPGEYLLLIVSPTPESQERVQRTLPPSTVATVCNYLDEIVTRVSGFTSVDTANAWARYMTESIGLAAFVAGPAEIPPAPALPPSAQFPPQPKPSPQSQPTSQATPNSQASAPTPSSTATPSPGLAFNPQPLGAGYAVLVDFFSQPELALQVRQLAGREIGLASYGQRPYLLAVYTADPAIANATLQSLTDRGFWAMVVDSRRVTVLRQTIDISSLRSRN